MHLIPYIRVSQVGDRSGASFISPEIQTQQIEAKARLGGHDLLSPIQDLDESGGNLHRPGWERAVRLVMDGRADGIAVAKLDRFSRNLRDALEVIEQFEQAGKVIVSAAEDFDPTTVMGRFARDIIIRLAQMERERIGENWRTARQHAVDSGVHAAPVPFGYRRTETRGIEPDPDTAPIVREMFERRAAGETWYGLCSWLDDVAPRPEGEAWPQATPIYMIGNDAYIGRGEGDSRHEAIVPRDLWERAQQAKTVGRHSPNPRLLTGIARCATCGGLMVRTKDGRGSELYRCRGRRQSGVCERPARVSVALADTFVSDAIRAELGMMNLVVGSKPRSTDREALARLELAESELRAYRDEATIAIIGRDAYLGGLAQRQRVVDEAREALGGSTVVEPEAESFDLLAEWDGLPLEAQREAVGALVDRLRVKPAHKKGDRSVGRSKIPLADRIEITWHEDWFAALATAATRAMRKKQELLAPD